MSSFGSRFGQIVRHRRGIEGLTLEQLAARAFQGGESSKSGLSNLERGMVAEPHQRTVDALVVALSISNAEVERCRTPVVSENLVAELGLRRELLELLALRFEHSNPDAPDRELVEFLKNKASEFRDLKGRLTALVGDEERLSNSLASARGALDAGDFEAAEQILAEVEELQQSEHTLRVINTQAEIRIARGQAALMGGDAQSAYDHFNTAANFFRPFDRLEEARRREELSAVLKRSYKADATDAAVQLLEENLAIFPEGSGEWSCTQYQIGKALAYGVSGRDLKREKTRKRFERGYSALLLAREGFRKIGHPHDIAAVECELGEAFESFGVAHLLDGERGLASSRLEESVQAFTNALELWAPEDELEHWIIAKRGVAKSLFILSESVDPLDKYSIVAASVTHYRELLARRSEHEPNWVLWIEAEQKLALGLVEIAEPMPSIEAIACLEEALAIMKGAHAHDGPYLNTLPVVGLLAQRHFDAIWKPLEARRLSLGLPPTEPPMKLWLVGPEGVYEPCEGYEPYGSRPSGRNRPAP